MPFLRYTGPETRADPHTEDAPDRGVPGETEGKWDSKALHRPLLQQIIDRDLPARICQLKDTG